ncbi:MAG: phenylalanine--tRNA ligase subunit alpha [Candidatus Baltobacteraceae bacterium]
MSDLASQLEAVGASLRATLEQVADATQLDEARVRFLGRSGELTAVRRSIGTLPAADRPAAGKTINEAAAELEASIAARGRALEARALEASLATAIDVTFPGSKALTGSIHPLRRTLEDACAYFERRGFAVVLGPEIETERNAFDALNIPADHPAREGFDTFYLGEYLLRPHTSPMQIRVMLEHPAPVAIVVPGKTYRRDANDARHTYMFHQIEGLQIGANVHMGHLKGVLTGLCREIFGSEQAVRFRPSFFPFTEPSAEIDTTCPACAGLGCRTCSGSGWIEIGGCGMVHPNVLRAVGYDPDEVGGWAFGCGIERLALTRYGMDDIRVFFENDPAVLELLA